MRLKLLLSVFFTSCLISFAGSPPAKLEAPGQNAAKPIVGKRGVWPPKHGVKIPGVQIPMSSLQAEAEFILPEPADWLGFGGSVLISVPKTNQVMTVDAKADQLGKPLEGLEVKALCGGFLSAFGALWIPDCADGSLVRFDQKAGKETIRLLTGTGAAKPALAATADSIWMLTDDKTTLSRIDPKANAVVGEVRLTANCNSLSFGEDALWATCPESDLVLRIDPRTNLVKERIEVAGRPSSVAFAEKSVWVLGRSGGKVVCIDAKTNKIVKTIELSIPDANGNIVAGEGYLWVTATDFPVSRIDPKTGEVLQQFAGPGGGFLQFGEKSLWLSNVQEKTVWRLDPRRILATLPD